MSRRRWSIGRFRLPALCALALALVGVVVDAGCSDDPAPQPATDEGGAAIVVGLSVSLTGSNSGVGAALRDGTQTAINLINARGGVLGKAIQLNIKDDASNNSAQGDRGAILNGVIRGFLNENVTAILGPGASVQLAEAQAMAYPRDDAGNPIPGTRPVLVISAWSTSPAISTIQPPYPNRFLYRTAPSDLFQSRAMFKVMTEGPTTAAPDPDAGAGDAGDGGVSPPDAGGGPVHGVVHKCRAPFLVYGTDIIGYGYFNYLPGAFAKIGITLKSTAVPTNVIADYTKEIDEIIAARADCVAFATYLDVGAAIIPKLRDAMRRTPGYPTDAYLIGMDAFYDKKFIDEVKKTNGAAIEGMVGVVPDTAPEAAPYAEFKALFQAFTARADEPPPYSANAFDAAVLLALAIQKAQTSTDTVKIRDALVEVSRGYAGGQASAGVTPKLITPATIDEAFGVFNVGGVIDYFGASGPVNFDDSGDVVGSYIKWAIEQGEFKTISRYNPASLPE